MSYKPLPAPGTTGNVMTSTGDAWASEAPSGGGAPSGPAGGDLAGTYPNPTVATGALPLSVIEDQASGVLIGRDSAGNGPLETITLNSTLEFNPAGLLRRAALIGDVTAVAGDNTTTIANDAVTNAKLANMAANTVKVRAASSTGDPSDLALSASQLLGRGSTGDVAAITLGANLAMSGTTLSATGGGGTFGQTTATFSGGADSVTVTVTDAGVSAGSRIVPTVALVGRDADEMEMAPVVVAVGSITAGVGFTLIAVSLDGDAEGTYTLNYTRD